MSLILRDPQRPLSVREIGAVKPNCVRIHRQMAMLEKEKAENDQRLLTGIQSVALALAAPMGRMSLSPRRLGGRRRRQARRTPARQKGMLGSIDVKPWRCDCVLLRSALHLVRRAGA